MTRTALLFPTGGAHWPAMGAELVAPEPYGDWLDRAEERLASAGVSRGALRRLMAGEGQAGRRLVEGEWQWHGDFPLSVAAQTALGCCLADAFIRAHGPPAAVLGESMGECAALGTAGALPFEEAVALAHRWARALAESSDRLGLRMAVVEGLTASELQRVGEPLDARIVVEESPSLLVVSLPRARLGALQSALRERADSTAQDAPLVRMLVSANHCVAHDPRLGETDDVWQRYARYIGSLELEPPRLPLWSTLRPATTLSSVAALRANLLATSVTPVLWQQAVTHLAAIGIERLVLVGMPTRSYVLDKLQRDEPRLAKVSIRTLRDLRAARSGR